MLKIILVLFLTSTVPYFIKCIDDGDSCGCTNAEQ